MEYVASTHPFKWTAFQQNWAHKRISRWSLANVFGNFLSYFYFHGRGLHYANWSRLRIREISWKSLVNSWNSHEILWKFLEDFQSLKIWEVLEMWKSHEISRSFVKEWAISVISSAVSSSLVIKAFEIIGLSRAAVNVLWWNLKSREPVKIKDLSNPARIVEWNYFRSEIDARVWEQSCLRR